MSEAMTEYSIEEERKLAKSFMGRIEWEMIVIGIGQCLIWFGLWFMVVQGAMALWLGCVLSILSTSWSYLPSHAGQHGHLSGKNKNLEWLNAFVGQISLIPLAQSHHVLKALHLKHHAHTNDPDRDPDYAHGQAKDWFQAALKVHNQTGEKVLEVVDRLLKEDPKLEETISQGATASFIFFFAQMIMAVLYPLETLLLWWVPRKLAVSYLGIVFSFEPHNNLPVGRYKDTRFWTNGLPRFINHSMQIHMMHHMYPRICHFDEPKAIEALKPFMVARGIPGAEKIPERLRFNPTLST
jgi:beta-carotene hydroxylase